MFDLQVNGYMGADFSSPDLTAVQAEIACRLLLKAGLDGFLPTVITAPLPAYEHVLPLWADLLDRDEFRGRLGGLHLEGPFISAESGAVGAHPSDHVRSPDVALLERLNRLSGGRIKLLTVAAEAAGAVELIRAAIEMRIVVSLGHQLAGEAEIARAANAGASAVTHLGSGLPNMMHRHHNPIWPALADDRLTMMVIGDGHHLPWPMLKSMIRAKGVERTIIVSDASPLAGLPPGRYSTMGLTDVVLREDGLLYSPISRCMAGSSLLLPECAERMAAQGFSQEDLRLMTETNPRRLVK